MNLKGVSVAPVGVRYVRFWHSPAVVIFLAALLLGGCSQLRDQFAIDPAFYFGDEVAGKNAQGNTTAKEIVPVDLNTYRFLDYSAKDSNNNEIWPTAYEMASRDSDGILRNKLQTDLIRMSNRFCEDHKAAITANAAGINVGTNILTSLFSGGAAVTTVQAASRAMSGVASFIGATRSHINEEIYYQQFGGTIILGIEKGRKDFYNTVIKDKRDRYTGNGPLNAVMLQQMNTVSSLGPATQVAARTKSHLVNYSVNEAISDALDYHYLCSFYHGIKEVNKSITRTGIQRVEVIARADVIREEIGKQEGLLTKAQARTPQNRQEIQVLNDNIQGLQRQLGSTLQLLQFSR